MAKCFVCNYTLYSWRGVRHELQAGLFIFQSTGLKRMGSKFKSMVNSPIEKVMSKSSNEGLLSYLAYQSPENSHYKR